MQGNGKALSLSGCISSRPFRFCYRGDVRRANLRVTRQRRRHNTPRRRPPPPPLQWSKNESLFFGQMGNSLPLFSPRSLPPSFGRLFNLANSYTCSCVTARNNSSRWHCILLPLLLASSIGFARRSRGRQSNHGTGSSTVFWTPFERGRAAKKSLEFTAAIGL